MEKRNNIRVSRPYCHVEKLWFVLCSPSPPCPLLTLFIYLFVFAQLVWLSSPGTPRKKPIFPLRFPSYFLFRLCFYSSNILVFIPIWVCCDFFVSVRTSARKRACGVFFRKGELSVIIMQYYLLLSFGCLFCSHHVYIPFSGWTLPFCTSCSLFTT